MQIRLEVSDVLLLSGDQDLKTHVNGRFRVLRHDDFEAAIIQKHVQIYSSKENAHDLSLNLDVRVPRNRYLRDSVRGFEAL